MKPVLISLRDPDDPMATQELRCFQESAHLPGLIKIHAAATPLDDRLLNSYDLFFFGGSGAYSVLDSHGWVRNMLDFLVRVVDAKKPAWASCFGFQGLALALGGEVNRDDDRQELGAFPIELTPQGMKDTLFGTLPPVFPAQLGHHDHVDRLPSGVTLLATGQKIYNQAFKVDGAPFWATQFHPELRKATTLERWNYYREHYADEEKAREIDAIFEQSPDTEVVQGVLARFVEQFKS
jgi:GMP synthase (glutamine-hydrolysing)